LVSLNPVAEVGEARAEHLVLVVDDDDSTRALLRLTLERAGYQIAEAQRGDEVLQTIVQTRPNALVLDMLMPGMNGLDVIEQLRNAPETNHLPILCLTAGLSSAKEMTEALRAGADDFLRKPFNPDELVARLDTRLRVYRLANRERQRVIELEMLIASYSDSAEPSDSASQADRLARAEQLAAIGTLSAGIAHEINNLLQPVLMGIQLALESLNEKRPVDRQVLEVAERELRRAQRLVRQLLDFSGPNRGIVGSVKLNDVIGEVLTLTAKQLQYAQIRLVKEFSASTSLVGNADQLKQVVLNLIVNAVQAMPSGGTLTVRTWQTDQNVFMSVEDSGVGITPEVQSRLFTPFFTTKADGTGLGLALSDQIVQEHGGRIAVESEPGQGATFTIAFPLPGD